MQTVHMTPLELRAGDLRLALRADLGGAIAGLWRGTTPVLRSSESAELSTPRGAACFALVPYSNRVGHRRFRWQGQDHTLAANFGDHPHTLHGVAWLRPWAVVSASVAQAELAYCHTPDAHWPFAFEVHQRYALTPDSLRLQLAITNRAGQPQPLGLGWHPYFPQRPHARLQIAVSERWASDASGLPSHSLAQAGIHAAVADMAEDHCYGGWQGPALISDDLLSLRLTSSLPYLVLFTPGSKTFFCVEPVSHLSNAIQMADPAAHGLRTVAPGDTVEAWMQLDIAAA
jgi:aldose 1-epimerase